MEPLLKQLLEVPTHSGKCGAMQDFILTLYPKAKMDKAGNLYITKGRGPYPCVVAHMDTVHRIEEGGITAVELNGNIYGMNPATCRQTGIGGDDKCGIWCALVMLHNLKSCKVALFVDEEIGCLGSRACDLKFFKDCRFILQADRRNDNGDHFVHDINGPLMSPEFKEAITPYVKKHEMDFVHGMMTDVQELRNRKVGVSCANISAGYYRPHSDSECINRGKLQKAIDIMYDICREVKEVFPFAYERPVYASYHTSAPASGPYANSGRHEGAGKWTPAYNHHWYKKPDDQMWSQQKENDYIVWCIQEKKEKNAASWLAYKQHLATKDKTQDAIVVEDGEEQIADIYLSEQEIRKQQYLDWWREAQTANQADQERLEKLIEAEEIRQEQQEIQAGLGL